MGLSVLFSAPLPIPPPPNALTVDVDFFSSVFFFLVTTVVFLKEEGKPRWMLLLPLILKRERGVQRVSFQK
jgi:hypothetical protein